MNQLTQQQVSRNADSRGSWDAAAPHRRRVTQELLRGFDATSEPTLCVVGAGNCNDLDLDALTQTFAHVHLVDIDGEALEAGVGRQTITHRDRITLHGGVDVTGIFDLLDQREHDDAAIDAIIERLDTFDITSIGVPACDMVASVCLLSQIIEAAVMGIGERHARFTQVMTELRRRHIRALAQLTKGGGYGLLVFDYVSSDSAPQIRKLPEDRLAAVTPKLVAEGNFFHGLSPAAVASVFDRDDLVTPLLDGMQLLKPWLWNHGARHYAVAAVKYRRKG